MPLVTIDDKEIEVAAGTSLIEAAQQLGIYIPHFCYHKKLSIAASCRMCLVEVEKAPKPLPACATPCSEGMKVKTRSQYAVEAQKGVMEFLLINHPLDCPICDQGGDCQLQDIAVGYGGVASRYDEPKRVVSEKDLGPLVSTDMTRCIHCSRCIRFGQEIAGQMELGMPGRGEHVEVMPFLETQINSELSGNIIDLCPVGALTSKPFRYNARGWELSRRVGVSPHDSLGSNLTVQVKDGRVMRVLPLDNEAINECWLSDRDRFAYQGLYAEDRLTVPMVKDGERWIETDWPTALAQAAGALRVLKDAHGGGALGFVAASGSTNEELFLLQKLARALDSSQIESHPLEHGAGRAQARWLGMPIAAVAGLDRILLIGSTLRSEQPLLARRVRQAVKAGAALSVVHAANDDLLCSVAHAAISAPSQWLAALTEIEQALQGGAASATAQAIATSLQTGNRKAVLLGALAQTHPLADAIHAKAAAIAVATGATLGFLPVGANSVGAALVGAQSGAVFAAPRKGFVVLGIEAELDCADGASAMQALQAAECVVALTAYKGRAMEYATVMLPIAPWAENEGSLVNMAGVLQGFNAATRAQGEARPAWKVLRVLGNQFGLAGFDFETVAAVRAEAVPEGRLAALNNAAPSVSQAAGTPAKATTLEWLAETPIYATDAVTRRAQALQATAAAALPMATVNAATRQRLGSTEIVCVRPADGVLRFTLHTDDRLADGVVRIAAGLPLTVGLGARWGALEVDA
jgi:NADH-quinone oxidoreductase subunit G